MLHLETKVKKIYIDRDDIWVVLFLYQNRLINMSFFKRDERNLKEIYRSDVSPHQAQQMVEKVQKNEVESLSPLEEHLFFQLYQQYRLSVERQIRKKVMSSFHSKQGIDYIGEWAGLYYMVVPLPLPKIKIKQLYLIQPSSRSTEWEIGWVPPAFYELILLDVVHHLKIKNVPVYFNLQKGWFVGMKASSKNPSFIQVIHINVSPNSISATKGYTIKKNSPYEYMFLPIEDITPERMEQLQIEGKDIVNHFIQKIEQHF